MFMKGKSNILTYQNNNIVRKIQARTARACLSERLGADQLTLEGGGGGRVILKKNSLQALVGRKKLHAAQM